MKDNDLVRLIRNDSEKGIARAIDVYGGLVHTVCSNILRGRSKEDVEEACSDTFVRLWKYIGTYDERKKASLKTYICILARSSALDLCKKYSDEALIDLAEYDVLDFSVNVEDEYIQKEMSNVIREVVSGMNEPDRSVFLLRYFYFFTVKEIALKLKMQPKQIENILYRRKEGLKKELIERGVTYHEDLRYCK